MEYNAAALDFLLPGVMSLAQVQSRRVLYDKKYDLEVPMEEGDDIRNFWAPIEHDLLKAKVGNFQTVEITICFVRLQDPEAVLLPVVTTLRRMYMPLMYKSWPEYRAFTDDPHHTIPSYIFYNELDVGRLKRVIVRLLPDLQMPHFWAEEPNLDFPLLEDGFIAPQATLLENMKVATQSSAHVESERFKADDVVLLNEELVPKSRTFLKPIEYTEHSPLYRKMADDVFRESGIAFDDLVTPLTRIAGEIPDQSKVARIIEVITVDNRSIVRFDYPLVADHVFLGRQLRQRACINSIISPWISLGQELLFIDLVKLTHADLDVYWRNCSLLSSKDCLPYQGYKPSLI